MLPAPARLAGVRLAWVGLAAGLPRLRLPLRGAVLLAGELLLGVLLVGELRARPRRLAGGRATAILPARLLAESLGTGLLVILLAVLPVLLLGAGVERVGNAVPAVAAGPAARKATVTGQGTVIGIAEAPTADWLQVRELTIIGRNGPGAAFTGRRLPLRVASMSCSAASRPVRERPVLSHGMPPEGLRVVRYQ